MKNENGFALMQVMIAGTLLTVMGLAVSNLIAEQRKSTGYLEDQLEKIQLIRNLETVLKDGMSCQKTLIGTFIPGKNKKAKVSEIKDGNGVVLYKSKSDTGNLKIGSMTVVNQSVLGPNTSGFVEVEVPLSRIREGGGPKELKPYKTKLAVTVDVNRKVTTCSATSPVPNCELQVQNKCFLGTKGWCKKRNKIKSVNSKFQAGTGSSAWTKYMLTGTKNEHFQLRFRVVCN